MKINVSALMAIIIFQYACNNSNSKNNVSTTSNDIVIPQELIEEDVVPKYDALLYFLNIHKYDPNKFYAWGTGLIGVNPLTYTDIYLMTFDANNYQLAKNDEFKRQKLLSEAAAKIRTDMNYLDFNKRYSSLGRAKLGEYDFNSNSFPVKFSHDNDLWGPAGLERFGLRFKTFVNYNEFNFNLKMSPDEAEKFIDSRKDSKGYIDRDVYMRIIYSFTKLQCEQGRYDYGKEVIGYAHKFIVYADKNATNKKLGEILPKSQWEDIPNGIKASNSEEIIYFNNNFKVVNEKSQAVYYKILKRENGQIKNPTNWYYMSGKLFYTCNLLSTYPDKEIEEGLSSQYYESGIKYWEQNYKNGIKNGTYTEWWPNGVKRKQVNYLNGKLNGCFWKWDEKGRCEGSPMGNFCDSYTNGELEIADFKCKCSNDYPIGN